MEVRQALPASSARLPTRTIRYLVIGGGALMVIGLILAAPAFACSPSASISTSPSSVQAGGVVNVIGTSFYAGDTVSVHWNGSGGQVLASTVVNANGQFAVSATVPAGTPAGAYAISARANQFSARSSNFAVVPASGDAVEEPGQPSEPSEPTAGSQPESLEERAAPTQPVTPPAPFEEEPTQEARPAQPVATPVAPPVSETPAAPAPAALAPAAPAPAAPAAETQTPAPTAVAPVTTTPVPAALTNTTRSPATTSTTSTPSTPAGVAPLSEPAPEGELVGVAATAYSPSTAERALLAGAGITTADTAPAALTAPIEPADPSVVDAAPFSSDVGESTPFDGGQGTTPWALVPLMLLAAGLLTASGAALVTEVRQRAKAKVKV